MNSDPQIDTNADTNADNNHKECSHHDENADDHRHRDCDCNRSGGTRVRVGRIPGRTPLRHYVGDAALAVALAFALIDCPSGFRRVGREPDSGLNPRSFLPAGAGLPAAARDRGRRKKR
jgi:hypothetical protein